MKKQNKKSKQNDGAWQQSTFNTVFDWGYSARIGNYNIELPKARKQRLYCTLCAKRITHIYNEHEHLRTRDNIEYRALRLEKRIFRARCYRERRACSRVLQ